MDDLIERLRDYMEPDEGKVNDARAEAADEIEALRNTVKHREGLLMAGQGEQIRLAADLLQEKIEHNRAKEELARLRAVVSGLNDFLDAWGDEMDMERVADLHAIIGGGNG